MTEIAWLVKFMMAHKLPNLAKDEIIARIGEVESTMQVNKSVTPTISRTPITQNPGAIIQSPSTQRILDEMALEAPVIPAARPIPVPAQMDKETGRAMVQTGKGTFGPRKF